MGWMKVVEATESPMNPLLRPGLADPGLRGGAAVMLTAAEDLPCCVPPFLEDWGLEVLSDAELSVIDKESVP